MPVIIARDDEPKWVDPKLSKEEIKELIKPFPDKEMEAYTVSQIANSAKTNRNVPELLLEVNYPLL